MLRAVALALAAREAGPLALETGSGSIDLAGADRLTVSAIRARRARGGNDIGTAAALSLRFASRPGLHSLMLPLKPGIPMRLSVSFATDGALADLVLAHDPATVDEDSAEALLATLRDGLEAPLGLFV